jgi:hypothetical protein
VVDTGGDVPDSVAVDPAGTHLMELHTTEGGTATAYIDDTAGSGPSVGTFANVTGETARLGANRDGNNKITGDICEVVAYRRELTSLERADVVSYLSTKWGLGL